MLVSAKYSSAYVFSPIVHSPDHLYEVPGYVGYFVFSCPHTDSKYITDPSYKTESASLGVVRLWQAFY